MGRRTTSPSSTNPPIRPPACGRFPGCTSHQSRCLHRHAEHLWCGVHIRWAYTLLRTRCCARIPAGQLASSYQRQSAGWQRYHCHLCPGRRQYNHIQGLPLDRQSPLRYTISGALAATGLPSTASCTNCLERNGCLLRPDQPDLDRQCR